MKMRAVFEGKRKKEKGEKADLKKTSFYFLLFTFSFLLWAGCTTDEDTGTGPGGVSGTPIFGEQKGILSGGPYLVTGDITVPAGETLEIVPGVELRFNGLYKFVVQGKLKAIGTPDQNIVFTSADGALGAGDFGQWRSIIFDTGDDSSEMAFCVVAFAAVWDSTERYPDDSDGMWLNSAIMIWNCSPFIHNCNIMFNGYHGIYCIGSGSNPNILNNNIYENDGDGIRCELGATAEIRYNNSKENNARQFAETPPFVGELTMTNVNRDSCDKYYNTKLDPSFKDFEEGELPDSLQSCSPLIGAGLDTLASYENIGSIPYYVGETELRGLIHKDFTLSGTWYVSCNTFVDQGDSLILDNATLLFQGLYQMRIDGLLKAEGSTFMPDGSNKWLGLLLTVKSDPASFIRECHFINASTTMLDDPYGGAITVQGVSPEISENIFEGSEFTAVSCQSGAQPEISYNDIIGFGTAAIYCYNNSHPYIHHNEIHDGLGYGIWCNKFSSPTIRANLIYSTLFIGIKCQNESMPTIEYNTIVDHDYSGVEINKQSNPTIMNNIIAFNGSPYKMDPTGEANAYGNGITTSNSSFPLISYNDVFTDTVWVWEMVNGDSALIPYGNNYCSGLVVDPSINLSVDPMFMDMNNHDFHLKSGSPCDTAASDGGEIGAYGLGNW